MKRRRKIGILLRNFIISTSIPSQAILTLIFQSSRAKGPKTSNIWRSGPQVHANLILFPSRIVIAIHGIHPPLDIPNVVYMITVKNDTFGASAHLNSPRLETSKLQCFRMTTSDLPLRPLKGTPVRIARFAIGKGTRLLTYFDLYCRTGHYPELY